MSADTGLLTEDESDEARGTGWSRPRRRGFAWLFAALLTLAVLCAGAAVTVRGWPRGAAEEETAAPAATASIERTTLLREERLDGTLGYAGGGSFFARSDGVLTWLPEEGTELTAGQRAWEVDGRPVILLRGDTPAYRTLEPGARGPDVRQFEQALAELGYGGFTVDDEYTWLTAEAVRRWQEELDPAAQLGPYQPPVVLLDLLAGADVFIENIKPGSLDRLGFTAEAIRALNPRLIHCSISGYGRTGPRRHLTGYDPVVQAESGVMDITGHAEGPPVRTGVAMTDYLAALYAYSGILLALRERERSGGVHDGPPLAQFGPGTPPSFIRRSTCDVATHACMATAMKRAPRGPAIP